MEILDVDGFRPSNAFAWVFSQREYPFSVRYSNKHVHMSFSSINIAVHTILDTIAARYALPADIASDLSAVSLSSAGTTHRVQMVKVY